MRSAEFRPEAEGSVIVVINAAILLILQEFTNELNVQRRANPHSSRVGHHPKAVHQSGHS